MVTKNRDEKSELEKYGPCGKRNKKSAIVGEAQTSDVCTKKEGGDTGGKSLGEEESVPKKR